MGVSNAPQYTSLSSLTEDIQKVLNEYRDKVLGGIANGIDEAAELFKGEAARISPFDPANNQTPHYKDSWAIKPKKKAKYVRYVGNTKKVKAHYGDSEPTIPLINILEFSTTRGVPHVGDAVAASKDRIINLIASKIEKES